MDLKGNLLCPTSLKGKNVKHVKTLRVADEVSKHDDYQYLLCVDLGVTSVSPLLSLSNL